MRPMSDLGPVLRPLEGGHSGRTFLGEVGGERAVVRRYPPGDPRGDAAPEVDLAVLGIGASPGKTNVMAAKAVEQLGETPTRVDVIAAISGG